MTAKEKAEKGVKLIEEAIVDLLTERGDWIDNSDLREELDLHSDMDGEHKGYLMGSIIQRLVDKNIVIKEKNGRGKKSRTRLANIK